MTSLTRVFWWTSGSDFWTLAPPQLIQGEATIELDWQTQRRELARERKRVELRNRVVRTPIAQQADCALETLSSR